MKDTVFSSDDNHKGGMKQEGAPKTDIACVTYCTKKAVSLVFCLFVFNKGGGPYASTSYLSQHSLTVKESSPLLLSIAIPSLTPTTQ